MADRQLVISLSKPIKNIEKKVSTQEALNYLGQLKTHICHPSFPVDLKSCEQNLGIASVKEVAFLESLSNKKFFMENSPEEVISDYKKQVQVNNARFLKKFKDMNKEIFKSSNNFTTIKYKVLIVEAQEILHNAKLKPNAYLFSTSDYINQCISGLEKLKNEQAASVNNLESDELNEIEKQLNDLITKFHDLVVVQNCDLKQEIEDLKQSILHNNNNTKK